VVSVPALHLGWDVIEADDAELAGPMSTSLQAPRAPIRRVDNMVEYMN